MANSNSNGNTTGVLEKNRFANTVGIVNILGISAKVTAVRIMMGSTSTPSILPPLFPLESSFIKPNYP